MEVDGSFGEGGGQILRTAICFAMVFGIPIHVTKIRAGRKVTGLRPQHSATIKILGEICSAKVEGAEVGSTELRFFPGQVDEERGSFNLGTAASIPLVLQAVIPAVSLMGKAYDLDLVGGTDVPWSPTSDYLEKVVLPAMREVGIGFSFQVGRRGYYPNGGGTAKIHIEACKKVLALDLSKERSGPKRASLVSRCARLPVSVAERQARAASSFLERGGVDVVLRDVRLEEAVSPGSSILVSLVEAGSYLGGDSMGPEGSPPRLWGERRRRGSSPPSKLKRGWTRTSRTCSPLSSVSRSRPQPSESPSSRSTSGRACKWQDSSPRRITGSSRWETRRCS